MEFYYLMPFIVLLAIAFSMVFQGWMILNEKFGYHENPKLPLTKGHPEMENYKRGEGLLVVNFDKSSEEDYHELYNRIQKLKMEELFEESSEYEDDDIDIQ